MCGIWGLLGLLIGYNLGKVLSENDNNRYK